ncbi:PHP domain-containing protein [Acidothermaceae bacterium B102]|nr:PHP domain-containing protein [Acidothermaceae bacterium B102]
MLSSAYPAAAASIQEPGRYSRSREQQGGYLWLAGDHHIHTQYSSDAQYRVSDQVRHASQYGLDWMVITDHGSVAHAKFGVDEVNPDIKTARANFKDTLVFQGVEWNIPSAEHGTVFVAPGPNEVAVLKQFENTYDGVVTSSTASLPANEALAISGLAFLTQAVRTKQVADALMLANHPARKGLDSPHEFRNWRDTAPGIAVGMEGAPGHQAGGIPLPGAGGGRGEYDFSPSPNSFAGYPLESYRTWGGFDFFTATVGGLWDSMLAEGKPWWVTANSDSHKVYADWAQNPVANNADAPWDAAGDTFNTFGRYGDPVYAGGIQTANSDFWPGFFSRTHVGSSGFGYNQVMAGIRAGRVWISHGDLIQGLDMRVRVVGKGQGVPLGGKLAVKHNDSVQVVVTITLQDGPNFAQFQPVLNRVDLIAGDIVGEPTDRDSFVAPNTKVVKSWDTSGATGTITLTYDLGKVDKPMYVRLRGTDGNRSAPGYLGADIDPTGPAIDVVGDADPWADLWFYGNPIFVLPPSPLPFRQK